MREELQAIDTGAVHELSRIKQEEDLLRSRLAAMAAKQASVSQEVFARVKADYEARFAALEREAAPLKARAREQFAALQALVGTLTQARREVQLAREELDLRHALGEFDAAVFTERGRAVDEELAAREAELTEADAVANLFVAAFHSEDELRRSGGIGAPGGDGAPPVAAGERAEPPVAEPMDVEATAAGTLAGSTMPAQAAAEARPGGGAPTGSGAPLLQPVPPPVPVSSSYATDALEVARLVADGAEYSLQLGTTTIGRAPRNDIRIRDASVSREHAKVVFTERGFAIYDLGSENGVWVNGERVKHVVLSEGDVVELGPGVCPLVFRGP